MRDLAAEDGAIEWLGVTYRTILSAAKSGGAMSIVDTLSPLGSGPPRHIHHDAEETFIVVEGRIRLWVAGETSELGPGEAVVVPRGTEHTFQVIGDGPCRKFVILTPGGFEEFFAEMAAGQFGIPEDMGAIVEAGKRHHLDFTGPPLGAE